jgi:GNAT superfamily N-acetyltransferase
MAAFEIKRAQAGDEETIFALLRELAEYEKLEAIFKVTPAAIARDYFGAAPAIHCDLLIADGAAVGLATWYGIYTSFAARRGLYLEDLFVRPTMRGRGYGKALLAHLAKTAVETGAVRVDWSVLTWNKPSIDFYESIGARTSGDWLVYRLEGDAMQALARG